VRTFGGIPLDDILEVSFFEASTNEMQTPLHRLYLHRLYTKTVEQGRREQVRSIVSEVIPGVNDLQILTEGDTPIVYLVYDDYGLPAALSGDGLQSLLRLSLELASRPAGLVLLEEPEVHQHPKSIQLTARAIYAAIRRSIQVILTTHSLELIDALVNEAKSDEELENLSVYRFKLNDGILQTSRIAGTDVAFARNQIEDDLR
jgi:predicted ATPase